MLRKYDDHESFRPILSSDILQNTNHTSIKNIKSHKNTVRKQRKNLVGKSRLKLLSACTPSPFLNKQKTLKITLCMQFQLPSNDETI